MTSEQIAAALEQHRAWLRGAYLSRALRAKLVHAGDKWRAKRLWIQCADGSWPPAEAS